MEAPGLMAFAQSDKGYWQCRFFRQPENRAEEDQACRGVWASCCGAAAYRGKDKRIIDRIAVLDANKGHFPEGSEINRVAPSRVQRSHESDRPVLSTPKPGFLESFFRRLK
jgi:hypothetical protein